MFEVIFMEPTSLNKVPWIESTHHKKCIEMSDIGWLSKMYKYWCSMFSNMKGSCDQKLQKAALELKSYLGNEYAAIVPSCSHSHSFIPGCQTK